VAVNSSAAGPVCANCGATVTSGAYCSACGQRIEHRALSMTGFIGEAAEVLTHADSRLWRTIMPLLFRPGFLTQQFLQGRRVSYLPPFRLYIVLSVLFFLVVPLTAQVSPSRDAAAKTHAELQKELSASTDPEEQAVLRRLNTLNDQLAPSAGTASGSCSDHIDVASISSRLQQALVAACEKTRADQGKELERNLIHNLGRAMFVFLPLLAALMTLLYLRQKRYYVEHLLLLLHNHAFAFLIMSAYLIATHLMTSDWLTGWLSVGLSIYVVYYLYESMRRVYGQGRALTLLKFGVLGVGYFVCGLFTLVLTALYSAVTL